ncbi:MAG: hypothetical protein JNG90_15670 [Planctomycetaceae bacterium]|nr:hypothetical protein [Planctomycetaceae bacterium]
MTVISTKRAGVGRVRYRTWLTGSRVNQFFDPLANCIAFGPLAVYLLLLGLINLARRPLVTTGGRDTAALAVGVGGLIVVGPMELFLPAEAVGNFGTFVWVLLLAFYVLSVTLVVLIQRPRLVIYNVSADVLRPILAEVTAALDPEVRWAGGSVVMPSLGVELHMEAFPPLRNLSLVASHDEQNIEGWQRLSRSLSGALQRLEVSRNPSGALLVAVSLGLVSLVYWRLASDPQGVAQAFFEMLRL